MSHEINTTGNRTNMAYIGTAPWWEGMDGLSGNVMQADDTLEAWKVAAGYTYTIEAAPVTYTAIDGRILTMENRKVLHRSDNGDALGLVSGRYKVVQPDTVMEFFRDLCSDFGFTMETAGILKNGSTYWALAKVGQSATIAGASDKVDQYALLSTACDGTMATTAKLTGVRVVCRNTLDMAMYSDTDTTVKTRHNMEFSPGAVKRELGLIDLESSWSHYTDQLRTLVDTPISLETGKQFFRDLLQPKATRRKELKAESLDDLLAAPVAGNLHKTELAKEPRGFDPMYQTYLHGIGQAGITGTAYGLLNGVTRYVDHERNKSNPAGRMYSAMFAQGAQMKQRALESALELAGVTDTSAAA